MPEGVGSLVASLGQGGQWGQPWLLPLQGSNERTGFV